MVFLDEVYLPNNFIQKYAYEYEASPHILDEVAWLWKILNKNKFFLKKVLTERKTCDIIINVAAEKR